MKIAVLGCGGMGWSVLHSAAEAPQVTGRAVYDIDANVRERVATNAELEVFDDLDTLLANPEIRLVFVTASNDAHKALTLAALDAGKAVLCEKPMANTLADAQAMVEAADRTGGFLQIGFELRYSKLYTTIKDWIDQGLLGDVVSTQCTYICSEFHKKGSWRNRLDTGGSMFGEKLCHYVDLPRWWVGRPVTEVYAACAPNVVPYYEVRDNYFTTCRYDNGAVSQLNFAMYVGQTFDGDPLQSVIDQQRGDGHELRYLITGTHGAAATDVFARSIKRWAFGDSPTQMTSRLVEERTWPAEEDERYFHDGKTQTLDVIRRVHEGLPPRTPARDALQTMRLVWAVDNSADQGKPVHLADEPVNALAGVRTPANV
jgi:predicted dehydrogenase